MLKLMNERDILRHKLCADKSLKEYERRGLDCHIDHLTNEMNKELKMARDKINRLEEVCIFLLFCNLHINNAN